MEVIPCTEAKESLDIINEKLKTNKTAMVLKFANILYHLINIFNTIYCISLT